MIRKLLDLLAARLPDPAPIVIEPEPCMPHGTTHCAQCAAIALPGPMLIGVDAAHPATVVVGELREGASHQLLVLPPTDGEVVAKWLANVRGEYQPWARRHAHQLIDELIERAQAESGENIDAR